MNLENIIKGIFTSILGAIAMGCALFYWIKDELNDWQAGALAVIGFALLWIREDIAGFIKRFGAESLNKYKKK